MFIFWMLLSQRALCSKALTCFCSFFFFAFLFPLSLKNYVCFSLLFFIKPFRENMLVLLTLCYPFCFSYLSPFLLLSFKHFSLTSPFQTQVPCIWGFLCCCLLFWCSSFLFLFFVHFRFIFICLLFCFKIDN